MLDKNSDIQVSEGGGGIAIFFWIMQNTCCLYPWPKRLVNCYFLLNYAQGPSIMHTRDSRTPVKLLFSFELCKYLTIQHGSVNRSINCYFLLNYAHNPFNATIVSTQLLQIAIFFWIMPLLLPQETIFSAQRPSDCYFLLNYARESRVRESTQ